MLLAACTGADSPSPKSSGGDVLSSTGATTSDTVDADGFVVTDGSTKVSGLSGVAPVGTPVRMRPASTPEVPVEMDWTAAVPGFDISFAGDVQPSTPVTVTATVTAPPKAGQKLAFITKNSSTDRWEGLPVTQHGNQATVQMTHFSGGWFGWVKDPTPAFSKALDKYLKLRFDPPACAGKSLELDGTTYEASVNGNGIRVCVEERQGKAYLTVHSNSPFVWRIQRTSGELGNRADLPPPLELSGAVTVALYHQLYKDDPSGTVVVPGGQAHTGLVGPGPWSLTADVDPALGLIAVLLAAIDMYGFSLPAREVIAMGECVAGLVDVSLKPDAGTFVRAELECLGNFIDSRGAAAVAILTSLSSLLVTQVVGIVGELTRTNHLKITVSATKPIPEGPAAEWAAPYPFGTDAIHAYGYPTVDGTETSLEFVAGATGSKYEVRNVRWEGWGEDTTSTSSSVRYCQADGVCEAWQPFTLTLTNSEAMQCGHEAEPTLRYFTYTAAGLPYSDGPVTVRSEPGC